ncbi:RCC1 domain-containing protein [Herbidospora sp. RD11066]
MSWPRGLIALLLAGALGISATPAQAAPDTQARSWGLNEFGQLGNSFIAPYPNAYQVRVHDGESFVQVATGSLYALGRDEGGRIYHWGRAYDPDTSSVRNLIKPQFLFQLPGTTSIAAGYSWGMALRDDGTLWTWGFNGEGQLGTGDRLNRYFPTKMTGLPPIFRIFAAENRAYAIDVNNRLWAWGDNTLGRLGDGTAVDRTRPVQLNVPRMSRVSPGANHTLAVAADNTVWAWGENGSGQLGTGSTVDKTVPVPVSGLTNVKMTAVGEAHSLALLNTGEVRSWGLNNALQLGVTGIVSRSTPGPTPSRSVTDIGAGNVSSHLLVDRQLFSFGSPELCGLGNCTLTQPTATPVAMPGMRGILQFDVENWQGLVVRDTTAGLGVFAQSDVVHPAEAVMVTNDTTDTRTFTVAELPDGVKVTFEPDVVPSKGQTKVTVTGDVREPTPVVIQATADKSADPVLLVTLVLQPGE